MATNLKLLLISLRRLSSRVRAKLARKLIALNRAATRLLASSVPARLGMRLCQVAVACALAAGVAAMSAPVRAQDGVSEAEAFNQSRPAIACDADGDYVVVWQSYGQDGNGDGVYARRYSSIGTPQSNEFRVNQTTADNQDAPTVAMDASGDFVVVWESSVGGYPYYTEIMARRYSADGAPLGDEFQVNENLTSSDEYRPDVAMDATGNFVVVWDSYSVDNNGRAIAGRRFAADGTPQGGQFQINSYGTGIQFGASVAMDANGDFAVVWEGEGLGASVVDTQGVFGRRFDSTGAAQGAQFALHTLSIPDGQFSPAVAMDVDGDFVAAFSTYIASASTSFAYYRRFNAAGVAQDANDVQINGSFSSHLRHTDVAVAMDADGDFVFAWTFIETSGAAISTDFNVLVKGYNAAGTVVVENEFTLDSDDFVQQPAIAMDADGDYAVVWREYDYTGYNTTDIVFEYDNYIDNTGTNAAPMIAGVRSAGDHHQITEGEELVHRPAGITVSISEQLDEAIAEDPANWSLTRDGVAVALNSIIFVELAINNQVRIDFAAPLGDGNYVLTAQDALEDTDANLLDGDFDGVAGGDFVLNFSVRGVSEAGGETLVNQTTADAQSRQSIAMDADGDFVVVWQGYASISGSPYSDVIIGRLYNANGTPKGGEFIVNTNLANAAFSPKVAMNADGDFVVAWTSDNPTNFDEIFARTFDADGTPNTAEIQISNLVTAENARPDVAMDADGEFVVVWESDYAVSLDIWGRKFDFDGSSISNSFVVNSFMTGGQRRPAVAMDADGAFTVVWSGYASGPSSGPAITMARFDSDGNARSGSFFGGPGGNTAVTLPTIPIPFLGVTEADVAMDADGDIVVVWTDWTADFSYFNLMYPIIHADVKAQRYTAAGVPVDTFFGGSVIDGVDKSAYKPRVAMDDDGDFVVSFTTSDPTVYYGGPSYIFGLDANVMVRRFAANGEAQGFAVQANTYFSGSQDLSSVACDADGDFIVTWTSDVGFVSSTYSQDGDEAGVYMQRFDENTAPTTSGIADVVADENDDPIVINLAAAFADDEDADAELTYTIVANTNPALIAAGIQGTQLGLAFFEDEFGTGDITIRATDTAGLWVEDTFTVTVNEVIDPVVPPPGDDDDDGCAASTTGAAPWGLLAVLFALFGGIGRLVRRKN
ncbi:MAG: hypothetical protein IT462_07045 [Planctomycetes bacterium]|nr:hypothetical protein [Planctomycetota bacterium]